MSNKINNKTLRALALGVSVGFTACVLADETDWFNVSFNGYTQGQQLTDAGATGGTWHSPIPDIATNVHDGVRNGIAINAGIGEALAFEPNAPAGRDIERIDFGLCAESLGPFSFPDFDGAAGLSPAKEEDGAAVYYGFTTRCPGGRRVGRRAHRIAHR